MESIREGIVPINFKECQADLKKKVTLHYDPSRTDSKNPGVFKSLCQNSYSDSLFGAHLAYSACVVRVKPRDDKRGHFEKCVQDSYFDMLDQVIMSPEESAVDHFVDQLAHDLDSLWNTQMAPRSGVRATNHSFMQPALPGSAQRSRANSTSQPPSPLSDAQLQKSLDSRFAEFIRAENGNDASSYNVKTTCIPYEYQRGCIAYEQGGFDLNQNQPIAKPSVVGGQFIGYLPSDAGAAKILTYGDDEHLYIDQHRTTTTLPFCTLSITQTGYLIYQDTASKTLYLGREQGNDLQWLKLEFHDDKLGGDVIRYTLSPDGNMIAVLTSNVSVGKLPVNTLYKIALSPILYERSGSDILVQARHIFKVYKNDLKNAEQIRDIILLPDQYNTAIILFYVEKHGLYSAKYKLLVMASDMKGGESKSGWGEVINLPKSNRPPSVHQTAPHLAAINDDQFVIYQSNHLQLVEVKHANKKIRLIPSSQLLLAGQNIQYCCAAENGTKVALIMEEGVHGYTCHNGLPSLKKSSLQDDSTAGEAGLSEAESVVAQPSVTNVEWS